MTEAENPPAFPFAAEYGHPAACGGMTLRDWFAGQAIGAVIRQCAGDSFPGSDREGYFAGKAYAIADAMLAARSENNGG